MNNIQNQHILKSMPLMASILGDKYGVEFVIGGDNAMTDGNIIYLPSLPLECDDTFLALLRGFTDHESAHIRYSDFELIKNAGLTDFEHFVWNCIEDWRIEQLMANHFSGCKVNLHWLIHHIFVKETKRRKSAKLDEIISEWLLLTVRSWDVDELDIQVKTLEKQIDKTCPQLFTELRALLLEVKNKCKTCEEALNYAKAIVACINNYIKQVVQEKQQNKQEGDSDVYSGTETTNSDSNNLQHSSSIGESNEAVENSNNGSSAEETNKSSGSNNALTSLRALLNGNSISLPSNLSEVAKRLIEKGCKAEKETKLGVAIAGNKFRTELDEKSIQRALRISTSLKARLQGVLQAQSLVRQLPSSHGRLNKNKLHNLAISDPKVFLQNTKEKSTNTAIHILLDASGSMRGRIGLANEACFALSSALMNTKGINLGVTVFPAQSHSMPLPKSVRYHAVAPIIKHGGKLARSFQMEAEGSTPLTETLWWVLPQLLSQKEERKIILLVTDGEPDDKTSALHAIEYAKKVGVEIYGIGIPPCIIQDILPYKCVAIEDIRQLPQAMFGLLQSALLGR